MSSSSTSAASSQNSQQNSKPTPTQRRSVFTVKPGVRFSEQPLSLPTAKSQHNISLSHYTYETPTNISFSNENLLAEDKANPLRQSGSRTQQNKQNQQNQQNQQPYKNLSLAKSVDHLLANIADSTPIQQTQITTNTYQANLKQSGTDLSRMTGGMTLSKSIKDLKLFVSNSFSPSLIIKPPVNEYARPQQSQPQHQPQHQHQPHYQPQHQPQQRVPNYENQHYVANNRRKTTYTNDYQNQSAYPVVNLEPTQNRQGVYKPRMHMQEAQMQMGRSPQLQNKNNEDLINCILDMKPMMSQQTNRNNSNYDNLIVPNQQRPPVVTHQNQNNNQARGGSSDLPRAQQVFSRRQEKPETTRIKTVSLKQKTSISLQLFKQPLF